MLDSKTRADRPQLPILALLLTLVVLSGCKGKTDPGKSAEQGSTTAPATQPAATAKIDVNSASIAELDKLELPGTKPSLSERIQGKRPYANADDLVGKKAISTDEYKLIKNLIVVGKAK